VEKVFAIQAGNEVRVIVNPIKVDDLAMLKLSHSIAKKIETDLKYPGQVKVTLRFGPEVKTAWVRVPVHLSTTIGTTAQTSVKNVRLQVEAPLPMLREAEAGRDIPGLVATVKVPGGLKPGRHALPYEVEAPEGVRVVSPKGESVTVTVRN